MNDEIELTRPSSRKGELFSRLRWGKGKGKPRERRNFQPKKDFARTSLFNFEQLVVLNVAAYRVSQSHPFHLFNFPLPPLFTTSKPTFDCNVPRYFIPSPLRCRTILSLYLIPLFSHRPFSVHNAPLSSTQLKPSVYQLCTLPSARISSSSPSTLRLASHMLNSEMPKSPKVTLSLSSRQLHSSPITTFKRLRSNQFDADVIEDRLADFERARCTCCHSRGGLRITLDNPGGKRFEKRPKVWRKALEQTVSRFRMCPQLQLDFGDGESGGYVDLIWRFARMFPFS